MSSDGGDPFTDNPLFAPILGIGRVAGSIAKDIGNATGVSRAIEDIKTGINAPVEEAKKAAKKQEAAQAKAEADLANQEAKSAAQKDLASKKRRQAAMGAAGKGRQGTILTSPLGAAPASDGATQKTLLGS